MTLFRVKIEIKDKIENLLEIALKDLSIMTFDGFF
jgi:hypothetical protein